MRAQMSAASQAGEGGKVVLTVVVETSVVVSVLRLVSVTVVVAVVVWETNTAAVVESFRKQEQALLMRDETERHPERMSAYSSTEGTEGNARF
jgi:hypothetical protein